MKNKILILYFFFLLPIIGFGQDFKLNYKPNKISKEVIQLADKLGETNQISTASAGLRGTNPKSSKGNFSGLEEKATINELIQLLEHPKPSVRGYTFWALSKREYEDLESIIIKHEQDKKNIFFISSCTVLNMTVIDFMKMIASNKNI